MAYTTIVAGTTITAAWANANLRDQVVTPFADSAARASAITAPIDGMVSTLTTTDRVDIYNGASWSALVAPSNGAWTTYTPTFTQSATITKTVNYAGYIRVGRMVKGTFHMTASSAGTAANIIQVGLPVSILATVPNELAVGAGTVIDVSATNQVGMLGVRSVTDVGFLMAAGYVGTSVAITIASGDQVTGEFGYPANTDA